MNLYFDHAYNNFFSEDDYNELEDLGFKINPKNIVEHPGTRFCRFINFNTTYLEFIDTKDPSEHRRVVPDSPIERFTSSGFSLGGKELRHYYETYREHFEKNKVTFEHRNYNWKENSKDYLSGWNFIRFQLQPIPNVFMWITEYEDVEKKTENKETKSLHKNRTTDVIGSVWSVDFKNSYLSALLCNTNLDLPNHTFYKYDITGKDSPLKAIVLKCIDLKFFEGKNKFEAIELNGKLAYHYKMKRSDQWDLIFTQ